MARKTRPLDSNHTTRRLRNPSTAQGADIPRATREQSERIVSLLLAVVDTIEEPANETLSKRLVYQRELTLKECRQYATQMRRAASLIDKIIAERIAQLPVVKP